MRPKELVQHWVDAFNRHDAGNIAALYHDDAVNHQITQDPVQGREAIRAMFERDFATVDMSASSRTSLKTLTWRSSNGVIRSGCAAVDSSTSATARSPSSAATGTSCRS